MRQLHDSGVVIELESRNLLYSLSTRACGSSISTNFTAPSRSIRTSGLKNLVLLRSWIALTPVFYGGV